MKQRLVHWLCVLLSIFVFYKLIVMRCFPVGFVMICFSVLLLTACTKDSTNPVQVVKVNLTLSMNGELANWAPNTMITITPDDNGYGIITFVDSKLPKKYINQRVYGKGIVVYQSLNNEFYVFDLTCTLAEHNQSCTLVPSWGTLLECPCCKSQFIIGGQYDAHPTDKSKATFSLRYYYATLDYPTIHIYSY